MQIEVEAFQFDNQQGSSWLRLSRPLLLLLRPCVHFGGKTNGGQTWPRARATKRSPIILAVRPASHLFHPATGLSGVYAC